MQTVVYKPHIVACEEFISTSKTGAGAAKKKREAPTS